MDLLPAEIVEFNPSQQPINAAVIWLHGLGANGHDFVPIVPELGLSSDMSVRFVFPHAPEMPVTINGGYVMPAWYDILEMSIDRKIDTQQILASSAAIGKLIEREISQGIPSERIVIAGFSQGGAVAYEAALSYPKPLAGVMALSTYYATRATIKRSVSNEAIPIFIAHGTADPVVHEVLGQQAVKQLQASGYDPEYHTYPMEHSVSPPEIQDIGQWLKRVLDS